MKTWGTFALYLLAVVLFGAIASPWIYWGFQFCGNQSDSLGWCRDVRFYQVLNRVLLLSAAGGAFILLAAHRVLSRNTLGLARSPRAGAQFLSGFGVAAGSVIVVLLIGTATGALRWEDDLSMYRVVSVLAASLCIALIVGVTEEIFFRGCLLGWLRQRTHVASALIVVTLFYAITHFLRPAKSAKSVDVHWDTGFQMLSHYGSNLAGHARWVPEFILLVVIGLTLGLCFLQTSRLYLSIGLHAGWVFAGKTMVSVTDSNKADTTWWFGHGKLIGSPITIVMLLAVLFLMVWMRRRPMMQNVPPAS